MPPIEPIPKRIDEPCEISLTRMGPRGTAMPTYGVPEFTQSHGASVMPTLGAVLWRGKLLLAAGAICGLLAGVAATVWTKPVYRARTSILVEGFNEQAMGSVTPVAPLPASAVDYLQNQVKVLESDSLTQRVAAALGNWSGDQARVGGLAGKWPALAKLLGVPLPAQDQTQPSPAMLRRIRRAITVRTGMQSQVIEVFFDARNPELAARGANAVTTEFIDMNRQARWQLVQDTTEWLNKQASELKTKLDGLNRQLENFTARSGLILTGPQGTPVEDRARNLQEAYTHAQADRAAKQARYEAAAASKGEVNPDPSVAGLLQQYQTELQNMRRQVADLRTIYQPDNYRVTRLEAQIATTESAIKNEREAMLARMKNDYLAAAALETSLARSLAAQMGQVEQQTQNQLEYNALKTEVDTTQKLYDSVLDKAKDAGAESSLRVTNIRVIDPAIAPVIPYSPNMPLNLALGLGIGTLGGVGLVLLKTRPGKIRHPGDVAALEVPELGVVPAASKELVAPDTGWVAQDHGHAAAASSLVCESFRAALISILFRAGLKDLPEREPEGAKGRVLVVSSIDVMEGKTTVVTNLGMASAQHRQNVLVVDADFRRPRLHQRFGVPNTRGLVDILRRCGPCGLPENLEPESFAQKTRIPHLSVMTVGRAGSGAENWLYTPCLHLILQRLARAFDLVFVDTPPLAMYPEARVLGSMSDGVVMVVRANTRTVQELQAVHQQLVDDRIPVLGIILNGWKAGRQYTRAYSQYYDYYQRRDEDGAA
jgi:polysaccharide biosynthesis transport protein